MIPTIRIALAEDHELVRQGMVALLKDELGVKVVFDVPNGAELLEKLRKQKVDIVLLDLDMPIVNGQQALKIINERHPLVKVIIVSMHYEDEFISECIAGGARGFLPKNSDIEKVVDAIFAVYEQGYYFDDKISRALLTKIISDQDIKPVFSKDPLTAREIQILELICNGMMSKDIAELLFLSIRTVEAHRKKILDKTNSTNVAGLVIFAIKHGIYKISN